MKQKRRLNFLFRVRLSLLFFCVFEKASFFTRLLVSYLKGFAVFDQIGADIAS